MVFPGFAAIEVVLAGLALEGSLPGAGDLDPFGDGFAGLHMDMLTVGGWAQLCGRTMAETFHPGGDPCSV